jgi:glucosyl-dolichyl phosphate glucuronosyltransferase
MKITVGICTWNRARLLDLTLGRMISMRVPGGVSWELLVVNNNSTDDTEKVLKSYKDRLPLRTLFEATPGKSYALNRAVDEARGDLIIWTDDDVLVDSDWLAAYATAVDRWPTASFFGGPIEPCFDGEPPGWLRQVFPKVAVAFAALNLGKEPCELTHKGLPFGANLAIRTEVQRRSLYDLHLGPRPNSSMRGEETAMLQAIVRDGLSGRWVPDARVEHFIPRARQTKLYLRKYYYGQGLYYARTKEKTETVSLFGYPRWLVRQVLQLELKYQICRHLCAPDVWIDDLILASTAWGDLERRCTDRERSLEGVVENLFRF